MKNRDIFRITIPGTVVSLVFALYFFKAAAFDLYQIPIYFILLGLTGSLSLGLLLVNRFRDTLYLNLLIYIIFVIVVYGIVNRPRMAAILLLYMLALLAAILFYVRMLVAAAHCRLAGPPFGAGGISRDFLYNGNTDSWLAVCPTN